MIDPNARVYVDANVFIYLLEGTSAFESAARRFFELASARRALLITSELTIAECLFGAHKLGSRSLARAYVDLFDDSSAVSLVSVDRLILESAAVVGAATKTKLIDAVHLASAVASGCEVFVTNDKSIRAPPGLKAITPFDIGSP